MKKLSGQNLSMCLKCFGTFTSYGATFAVVRSWKSVGIGFLAHCDLCLIPIKWSRELKSYQDSWILDWA